MTQATQAEPIFCVYVSGEEKDGERSFPILIGIHEAVAIDHRIKGVKFPRPMTHDLLNNIINHLQLTVEYILINKIEDSTFFANIVLYKENETMEVDARPSDAIALAIRTHAPILVEEEILSKAGIKMNPHKAAEREKGLTIEGDEGAFAPSGEPEITSDDAEERFRDFIDDLRPEDFLKYDTTLPDIDPNDDPSEGDEPI